MQTGTYVYCTTQFEWWHHWPDAPNSCRYLRDMHRHMFHVKVTANVTHADRDIEFIDLKHRVLGLIEGTKQMWDKTMSCEMICMYLIKELGFPTYPLYSVEVSEDGENGAIVVC